MQQEDNIKANIANKMYHKGPIWEKENFFQSYLVSS